MWASEVSILHMQSTQAHSPCGARTENAANEGRTSRFERDDTFHELRSQISNTPSISTSLAVRNDVGWTNLVEECSIRFRILFFGDDVVGLVLNLTCIKGVEDRITYLPRSWPLGMQL